MANQLQDRVVVITGAGRGLGRAYALACASAGASVLVNDRDREPAEEVVAEISAGGGRAAVNVESVGTMEAATRIVAAAVEAFGRIDVMVTNAGADRRGPTLDLTTDDWDFTLNTHLFGSIYCSIAAGQAMKADGRGGSIINIVSDAFHTGVPTMAPYSVAKGGIYSLMRTMAAELAADGIAVNAVAPPLSQTRPALDYVESFKNYGFDDDVVEAILTSAQLPADVAPIVVYLASPQAQALSGRVFSMTRDELRVVNTPVTVAVTGTGEGWKFEEIAEHVPALIADD